MHWTESFVDYRWIPKEGIFGWTLDDPAGWSRAAVKRKNLWNYTKAGSHQDITDWSSDLVTAESLLQIWKSNRILDRLDDWTSAFISFVNSVESNLQHTPLVSSVRNISYSGLWWCVWFICDHCYEACHWKWALPVGRPAWYVVCKLCLSPQSVAFC